MSPKATLAELVTQLIRVVSWPLLPLAPLAPSRGPLCVMTLLSQLPSLPSFPDPFALPFRSLALLPSF